MKNLEDQGIHSKDHSDKSILARACDPAMSYEAAKAIPPLIGDPEYIPTTNDTDFIDQLKARRWSVIFFAPGACRFSSAKRQIPGGIADTQGWTLNEYRSLVRKHQGNNIQIVETTDERDSVNLLRNALNNVQKG